jgi:hypothetical protein
LGLVAGVVDQIGLVECIEAQLGRYEGERISAGQVMKAMILNGLGFVSAPSICSAAFSRASPPSMQASRLLPKPTRRGPIGVGAAERHPDTMQILGPPPFETAREQSAARAKA